MLQTHALSHLLIRSSLQPFTGPHTHVFRSTNESTNQAIGQTNPCTREPNTRQRIHPSTASDPHRPTKQLTDQATDHPPNHPPTHPPNQPTNLQAFIQSVSQAVSESFIDSSIQSSIRSLIQSLMNWLAHSLTHSLIHSHVELFARSFSVLLDLVRVPAQLGDAELPSWLLRFGAQSASARSYMVLRTAY